MLENQETSCVISLEEARSIITDNILSLPPVEIPLSESFGHALAEDLHSDMDYPTADRSMMDGYVIRAESIPGDFDVIGEIPAAGVSNQSLTSGQAMRIFTGAMLPENGGRVVMQEDCSRDGAKIHIGQFNESLFIRRKASEAKVGDLILPAGTRIAATEMAILAQLGCVNPKVIPTPRVCHIATGSELVSPENIPAPGQIRDSNSSLLLGLFRPFGGKLKSSRVADDPVAIKDAISEEADLILISGGASVGDHDLGADVLRNAGFTIHFDTVNLRPGKPLTFATRGRQVAFVIPGNPISHFVCFHIAIRLAIELMRGLRPAWDFLDLKISDHEIIVQNPRETFWPASVSARNGELVATPHRWSTSGNTFSLSETNALIRVNGSDDLRTLLLDLPRPIRSI